MVESPNFKQKITGGGVDFLVAFIPYFVAAGLTGSTIVGIIVGLMAFGANNILGPSSIRHSLGTMVSGQKVLSAKGGSVTPQQSAAAYAMFPVAWLVSPLLFVLAALAAPAVRKAVGVSVVTTRAELGSADKTYQLY